MPDINELIINISTIVISFFIFMIYLTIFIIHIKKSILKKGYFTIVFTQIILESFIILAILCISIFPLIKFIENKNICFTILILIYNFCYICDILYNIQSLLILIFKNKKPEDKEDLEYDLYDNEEKSGIEKIKIDESSYAVHHIFSFLLSGIETIFFYFFSLMKKDDKDEMYKDNHAWYFYFLGEKGNLKILSFFFVNVIYFISALAYCFKKDNLNSLKLKNYSIYCLVSSLLNFIYPAKIILLKIIGNKINDTILIFMIYIYFSLSLVYLIYTCYYRLNCYYVQFVLGSKDNHFCSKLLFGLKIIFACSRIPDLNFADFNSNFIFHSLTGKIDIKDVSNDNNQKNTSLSHSISYIEEESK